MKPILLLIFFFPGFCNAQSKLTGLASYQIGITTPDSLSQVFTEQDQSYIKGTIALPCTHIRTFISPEVTMEGITLTNVALAFYDNTLFRLSCDYSDDLKEAFQAKHGQGLVQPTRHISLCNNSSNNLLLVRGATWQSMDITAYVVRTQGHNANCQLEDGATIVVFSQRFWALSSDCEVRNTNSVLEEFEKTLQSKK